MNLEEKQEHFEYRSPKDLHVHGEPFSPAPWNEKLLKIAGRCPAGDQRLRIVWGGTEKKRAYAQLPERSIEVQSIKYPGPIPKVRDLIGFAYIGDAGKFINVQRADQIPKGRISIPRYDYFELGMLRWMLERKYTPEELVAMGHYPDPKSPEAARFGMRGHRRYMAPMDKKGEYVGLYPIQTPDGSYWEPDEGWFVALAKATREAEAATEGQRAVALNTYMEKLEADEKRAAEEEEDRRRGVFENAWIEAEKEPTGLVVFDQGR